MIPKKLILNESDIQSGDGFYPILYNNKNIYKILGQNASLSIYHTVEIYFYQIKYFSYNAWVQYNGNVITGFDNTDFGLELLNSLNSHSNTDDATIILNSGGRVIYPITYNSTYRILQQYPD